MGFCKVSMSSQNLRTSLNRLADSSSAADSELGLQSILTRLALTLKRDHLVQSTLDDLRQNFQVNRVVLYYFFRQWRGQVTAESLSHQHYSILGSAGADDCFNQDYARLYETGRVSAIADITQAAIAPCHLEFLQSLGVRANLIAPVLLQRGLWGLLVAHHCQEPYTWSPDHIDQIQQAAQRLAQAESIC